MHGQDVLCHLSSAVVNDQHAGKEWSAHPTGPSVLSENAEDGEDWDNQDAADLDAQAYLRDLSDREDVHEPSVLEAQANDDEDVAESIQQVSSTLIAGIYWSIIGVALVSARGCDVPEVLSMQVWEEEGPECEPAGSPSVRTNVSHMEQSTSERMKQVVPALQSQHETFKYVHLCTLWNPWITLYDSPVCMSDSGCEAF